MTDNPTKIISPDDEPELPGGALPPETRRADEPYDDGTRRIREDETAFLPTIEKPRRDKGNPLGTLDPGVVICGNCQILRTLQPHEMQRAGLFLCQAPEGTVVVKVAAMQYPPLPEIWQRLVYLNHPNVLKCYRTFEEDGFHYEVQEFCPFGSLEERVPRPGSGFPPVSSEWIMTVFMPQMHAALQFIHSQEVIHRDIKPANIYLKSEQPDELVLGDFDISSVLDITRTSRDTKRAAGTWIYTAPEAFPRFIDDHASSKRGRVSRGNDYFSLGITIIELLMGTTSLHQCQLPDLFDFYLQGGNVEIPRGIPARLSVLLQGLLIRNRRIRWGAPEVERWLNDSNNERDLKLIQDDKNYALSSANKPFYMKAHMVVDLPGLAEAMYREPELAKEDLITSDLLLAWIGDINQPLAREIKRDRNSYFIQPNIVLHRSIFRCDPTRPFIFTDGNEVYTTDDFITYCVRLAQRGDVTSETLCTEEFFQQLEAWLRLKDEPETSLADSVAKIQQSPPRVQLEELAYLFQPDRPYVIARGLVARTPVEFAKLTYGKAGDWQGKRPIAYESSYQRWIDGALTAWLRQRGLEALAAQCESIRENLGEEQFAAFETILRLLDPSLPPVEVLLTLADDQLLHLVFYNRQRSWKMRYSTRGCGVPFGALLIENDAPGVSLENHLIRKRDGAVNIHVDPRFDLNVSTIYNAMINMESGFSSIINAPLKFSYAVTFPKDITVKRIIAGALICSMVLGIPRLVLWFLGQYRPVSLYNQNTNTIWDEITQGNFPFITFIIGLLVLAAFVYTGLRVWFAALRKSET